MSNWNKRNIYRVSKGFTLIEVLFVLVLMMIVVLQVAPHFSTSEGSVRLKIDSTNRLRIEGAVDLYKIDTGKVPLTLEDLILPPSGVAGWRGPYLEEVPVNPFKGGEPYELDEKGKVKT